MTETTVTWMEEPGAANWHFERDGYRLTMDIGWHDDRDSFRAHDDSLQFATAVSEQLDELLAKWVAKATKKAVRRAFSREAQSKLQNCRSFGLQRHKEND